MGTHTTINLTTGTVKRLHTLRDKYNFKNISDVILNLALFYSKKFKQEDFRAIRLEPLLYSINSPASLKPYRQTVAVDTSYIVKHYKKQFKRLLSAEDVVSALISYHKKLKLNNRAAVGFHKVKKQ